MPLLRSVLLIINYKTFIITTLAVASTWLCSYYGFEADFPLTILGIAIVFPVVFSIDSAYKRRERTLALLSDFKANMMALHFAAKDWVTPPNRDHQAKLKHQIIEVFDAIKNYCTSSEKELGRLEGTIYSSIASLSSVVQEFRDMGLNAGEMSRANQYVNKLIIGLENIKIIRQYRTPVTLRAYSRVFIYSFPILYGPYFVFSAHTYTHGLEYFMPVIFSFILVSLDNIQEHLENPFDQIGEDDVKFDVENFSEHLK